jgi:hypothetical protein
MSEGLVTDLNYTRVTSCAKHLAPAMIHRDTSPFILVTRVGTEDSHQLKVLAFRSLQISQGK